jgi:Uma2 family endonuclease
LCNDETLASIAYKIEIDAWGAVRMSPAQTKHSRIVGRIGHMLKQKWGGEAMPELAIVTPDGVKVPDVAWCSESFLAQYWSDVVLRKAPEICLEVVSPSNSEAELRAKIVLYLNQGAIEVWLVSHDGAVEIHTQAGPREDSTFGFSPAAELSA